MHKNIKILNWFDFFIDFSFFAPVAILYFASVSGSYALGMSVFSIATISAALLEIPTGIFSDKIGRRKTVILGATAAVFSAIFYAIGHSFLFLAIGAFLFGLCNSFYSGNNDALLYDSLAESNEQDKFGEYYGRASKMDQIGLAISGAIGIIFLFKGSYALAVWFSVIPQIICLILAFLFIEPKYHSAKSGNIYLHLKEAIKGFKENKKLRLLSLSSIMGFGFGEVSFQFQSAVYNMVWPTWAIPIAKILSNSGAALSFHFSKKTIGRFGELKMLLAGSIYGRIINSIAVIFLTPLSPILMSTTSLLFGSTVVAKNSLMQREFKQEQRATMGSLDSFAGSLLFAVTAFLLGLVADKLTPAKAVLILQFVQLSVIVVYLKLFKHQKSSS